MTSIQDTLPANVQKLPRRLQEAWLSAYQGATAAGSEDGAATRSAWTAVRKANDEARKARRAGKEREMSETNKDVAEKSLNLMDWQMAVASAFEAQYPAFYGGLVFNDHLITYEKDGPRTWKAVYTLAREAVGEGETEMITGVTFAPQAEWVQVVPVYAAMKIFEQEDGRVRWLAVSSGGFEDWDGEVVSTAFLEDCVERADKMGEHGELWVAHVPGTRIGDCDFMAMSDGFLLESGLFDQTPIGERAKAYLIEHPDSEVSITFAYRNRSKDGVYAPPGFIIERSILPAGAAAFPWSSISLMEMDTMATISEPKRKALADILGDEAAGEVLAGMERGAKALQAAGVRFKELAAPDADKRVDGETENAPPEVTLSAEIESFTEFELSDEALDGIADKLWQRVGGLVEKSITPLGDQVGKLCTVVEAMGTDLARLTEAEDERIAEKAANLPRATVRRILRPTQEKSLAEQPEAPTGAGSLLDIGKKTLYG